MVNRPKRKNVFRKGLISQTATLCMFITFILSSNLFGVDLPTFYRTPLFQGETKYNTSDWTTFIEAQYAEGSTRDSWNTQEVKSPLFNMYGAFDLRKLAANMEDLSNKPLTNAYAQGNIPNLFDGRLGFKGKFDLQELNLTLQQNLLSGFYAQAYIPFKKTKLCGIDYCQTVTTDTEHTTLVDFVNNDLDAILEENDICGLKTPFEKNSISDPLISLGWHGHCTFPQQPGQKRPIISSLRGFLQGGILIPLADRKRIDRVFSLSPGFNRHFGINARGNIHATIWKRFALGANAGATIFFKQTYDQRLTTSTDQNGFIVLEKGKVTVDQGAIWDGTLYAKAERIFGGLSALIGYSFTQQEKTTLVLKDETTLKTALENNVIKNKDEVINSNKLLSQWYHHALHGYIEYDFSAHKNLSYAPLLRIAYHHPLLGKHSWATEMFSGTLGLTANWCW